MSQQGAGGLARRVRCPNWFICFLFRDKGDNSSNYILRVVIKVVLLDVGEDEVPGVGDELQGLVLDPVLVV